MIYVYRNEVTGNEAEFDFPLGTAPSEIVLESGLYRRKFTVPGVSFKGSGFYSTDKEK